MVVDIKKLTVSSDEQREGWMELLSKAGQYHHDMAERFKPSLIGLEGDAIGADEDIYRIHTAWSRGIRDAVKLIDMWKVEEEDDIKEIDG